MIMVLPRLVSSSMSIRGFDIIIVHEYETGCLVNYFPADFQGVNKVVLHTQRWRKWNPTQVAFSSLLISLLQQTPLLSIS